jgi:PhnB protein
MEVQPYLFFDGRCEEAIEFYQRTLGATVNMMVRFNQSPDPTMSPSEIAGDKIMHAQFNVGSTTILASDGRCTGKPTFQGFALSITLATEADADRTFAALSEGGQVQMPLTKTFFSPRFGMAADKFGVSWMVLVGKK